MTKIKVQYEYTMHCLSEILYEYMASAEGLSEWFADEVVERGDDFYFSWNGGMEEKATLIRYKPESFVRFRWEEDEGSKYYFELIIVIDEITDDLSLNITDFCEEDDREENKLYWENLIENLRLKLGAS
ncbi:START-like domain-containing protein [Halpernia sp.]|uniref:START-like domain-containing protein n=1 Tax=Halpernia sp. TaxID=2782209 RepID=UPI003A8CEB5B